MKKKNFIKSGIKNKISNQKGMALLATLIFVFILVTFGVALLTMTSNDSKLSTLQRESTRAFYLAETGIEKAIWYLNSSEDNPDGLNFKGPLHGGSAIEFYDVDVSDIDTTGPDEIKTLSSTGKVTGGGDYNKGTRTIEVKLKKGIAPSPHLTYDYAVLTDGNMEIDGSPFFHGNIHSNGDLIKHGEGTVTMEYGSATATGSADLGTGNQPYQEFPHIYWDYYEDISKTQEMIDGHTYNNYYSGNVTFDSSDTLYGIHFINGDVTITTDLILHDAAIFATGNIIVKTGNADVTLENSDNPNPLSLIAKGNIEIDGGSIHGEGIIQTEGSFTLKGNVNIQKGAIYADEGIFKGGGGGMNVYYDTNLADIVVPGTGIPVWVKLSWQEVY